MLKIQTRDSLACRSKGYGTPVTVTSVGHLFKEVMGPVFNVDTLYILVHEFAKSQGMVHWHGLCWPSYREPHNLMFLLVQKGTIVGLLLTYHQYLLLLMEKDPHLKLFIGVSKFLESLLEDHLLLANGIDIHRCSEYNARFFKNTVPSSKKC